MSISLTCPECNGKLKVADNLAGKKIKCPKCSAVFPASAPAAAAITAESPPAEPEGITDAPSSNEEFAEEALSRPRKKARDIRRDPAGEAVSTFIPYKNAKALIAYYLGVFSFIPCLGLLLGPAALILGILGLRYAKTYPTAKGAGHAIAGIIMGSLTTLGYWGFTIAMIVMGGLGAMMGSSRTTTVGGPVAIVPNNPGPGGNNPMMGQPGNPQAMPGHGDVNFGQPLFSSDRDLVNPAQKLSLPAEPGRMAALRMGQQIHALALARDGQTLAVANQSDVKLWILQRGQSRTIAVVAQSLAFSADGTRLAVGAKGGGRGVIELYNTQTLASAKKLFEGPQDQVPERLAFSPDGSLFVAPAGQTRNAGSTLNVWETATWQRRPQTVQDRELTQIVGFAFDRNGKTLAVALNPAVVLLDPSSLKEQSRLKGQQIGTAAVAWSSDGKMLATGAFFGDVDLWDVAQHKFVRRLQGPRGRIHSLVFTPDDKAVVSGSSVEGLITVSDVATGKQLTNRRVGASGKQLTAFAASADGKTVVTGSNDGLVKVWDVTALSGQAK